MAELNDKVRKIIENEQVKYALRTLGENYLKIIAEESSKENLFRFIDNYAEFKFSDDKLRDELKVNMKAEILNEELDASIHESKVHKRLLIFAKSIYQSINAEISNDNFPHIATLYSHSISAEINDHDDLDKPVIFFHGEIFTANLLLCKLFAQSIPFDLDKETILFKIDPVETDNKVKKIANLYVDFLFNSLKRNPHDSKRYFLHSDIEEKIAYYFIESLSLFIFSHEMGHHLNNDFIGYSTKGDEEKRMDEREADLYALNQVVKHFRNSLDSSPFLLLGPAIYFYYWIFLEEGDPRYAADETHPSAIERLSNYRMMIFNFINDDEVEEIKNYFAILDNIIGSISKIRLK